MKLWKIGLIVFILSGLTNAVLIKYGVGGVFRELARLSVLAGLIILIVGLVKRKKAV